MALIDRRQALIGTLAAGMAARLPAQSDRSAGAIASAADPAEPVEALLLWPDGAPGMSATPPTEIVDERSKTAAVRDRSIRGIARPRLVVFRPTAPNGAAVVVMPGGGYRVVVVDKEGYEVARWLAARGYTVFVLLYRLPGEGWAAGVDVALADAQRAIRLIRTRAADYGVMSNRVVAMGFSAGGHVCGDLATRFAARTYAPIDAADRLSARPDAAAPIYAVQSMTLPLAHKGSRDLLLGPAASPAQEKAHTPAFNVTRDTPPWFTVHAEDDDAVPVDNTLAMRAALKGAGISVETHLFARGGHGFGLRRPVGEPVAAWPDLFHRWLRAQGLN